MKKTDRKPADPPTATPEQGEPEFGTPVACKRHYERACLCDVTPCPCHCHSLNSQFGAAAKPSPSPLSLADVPRWVFTSSHGRERFNPDFDRHMGLRRFVSVADIEPLVQRLEKENAELRKSHHG